MRIKQIPEDFIVEEIIDIPLEEKGNQTYGKIDKQFFHPADSQKANQCYFWLTKTNWTTEAAIRAISKACNVSQRRFKFAGSKDKIAVTKQLVSAFKVPAEVLQKIKLKDISLEVVGQGDKPISLGALRGNKFEIVIRDLAKKDLMKLNKNFSLVKKSGFKNFFGEQRFGKGNTHIIGKYILTGQLHEAVRKIICFAGEKEREDVKAAKKFASENWKDWRAILERFPKHLYLERDLLFWLIKNPTDFAGALRVLPKHIRKLYVHAYQSWLWNSALSKLKIVRGNFPVPGFATTLGKNIFSKEIKKLLEKDNLTLESFKCARMPELAVKGESRKTIVMPKHLTINAPKADDLNPGKSKIRLSFDLPKGCYATVLLEELQA